MASPSAIDPDEEFAIAEGEVDELEKKWVSWNEDFEENKRLVIDEIEVLHIAPTTAASASVPYDERSPKRSPAHWKKWAARGT